MKDLNTGINYQEALKLAAQLMVRVRNPHHLIKMITKFLGREMGITHASIIVLDAHNNRYVFCDSRGEQRIPLNLIKLDFDNPIIKWFSKKSTLIQLPRDYISQYRIEAALRNPIVLSDLQLIKKIKDIQRQMNMLKAELCVPGYYKGELLGIFFIGKKQSHEIFNADEISFLQTLASDASMSIKNAEYNSRLEKKVKQLEHSLSEIKRLRERDKEKFLQTTITLAHMVDARDPYTYGHSEEIMRFGMMTVREMGLTLDGERSHIVSSAFLLHDIGKLGVPDEILHKNGPLNDDEWVKMRDHVKTGARILEKHDDLKEISTIIMHHHENFDGSGYPYKLRGEEIPLESRIISVVDAFHAMVSDRPYRKGLSYDFAREELLRCSGSQFDPEIVNAFIRVLDSLITS